ncbi:DUF6612 family protein [Ornithinibacillus salinisoli]|uniref:DUF6612 family protein n=1 Tax=Ornithinibacillus salinisoli TaxID=1848459 RepID=A0ABW4W4B6_9BACI
MKKWMITIMMVMLATGLVACGGEGAQEVYKNAMESADKMESAEFVITMNQEMVLPDNTEMVMESEMNGSMTVDPVAMYQKGNVSVTMQGDSMDNMFPMDMDTEIYLVDNEMYVYESMMGQWVKMDTSMVPSELMDSATSQQLDVSAQFEMLEQYVDDLDFEETDSEYIYKLSADSEGFKEFTEEMIHEYMPEELTAQLDGTISEVLENMEIDYLNVEMVLDKKTYDLRHYNMDMSMKMNVEGEEISIVQQIDTDYKNINSTSPITVPQEVMDAAVDGM